MIWFNYIVYPLALIGALVIYHRVKIILKNNREYLKTLKELTK